MVFRTVEPITGIVYEPVIPLEKVFVAGHRRYGGQALVRALQPEGCHFNRISQTWICETRRLFMTGLKPANQTSSFLPRQKSEYSGE